MLQQHPPFQAHNYKIATILKQGLKTFMSQSTSFFFSFLKITILGAFKH